MEELGHIVGEPISNKSSNKGYLFLYSLIIVTRAIAW